MKIRCKLIFSGLFMLFFIVAPGIVKAQVACGDIITTDTTLDADIGPCSGGTAALTVQGPATLDLNGFSVVCSSINRPSGIDLMGRGATLRHGVVQDCDIGVRLMGTGQHRVEGVVSLSENAGFKVFGGSDKNILTRNASPNNEPGFVVLADKCILTNNTATGTTDASGFQIFGNQNTLRNNVSALSELYGFVLSGQQFKIFKNLAVNNDSGGFNVLGSGHTINQNKAYANGEYGISLDATDSEIRDNISLGHATNDLIDNNPVCDNNAWEGNLFGTRQVNDGIGDQTCIE